MMTLMIKNNKPHYYYYHYHYYYYEFYYYCFYYAARSRLRLSCLYDADVVEERGKEVNASSGATAHAVAELSTASLGLLSWGKV